MLVVGDILQLPPVNGTPVFQPVPNKVLSLRLGCIGSTSEKDTIVYDELTINERQKADKLYTDILDRVRRGFPSVEALTKLNEKVFQKPIVEMYNQFKDKGKQPTCLFSTRKAWAQLNNALLETLDNETVALHSTDVIDQCASNSKWSEKAEERLQEVSPQPSF